VIGPAQAVATAVTGVSLAAWLALTMGHGRFWRTSIRLPPSPDPSGSWPSVVAVVPARNEADVLPTTLPSLLRQRYPGRWHVIVVDDDSSDGTGALAADLGAEVVTGTGPPPGWAGKPAAMHRGVQAAGTPDYLLFTDADIAFPEDAVRRLVAAALGTGLVLTSQMVRLRARSRWERLIVPAFVFFFAQLYPFALVNRPGRTAAAAGGCMLVERAALARAGGLEPIRAALIDDVALGGLLKAQGPIWLGLSDEVCSIRAYPRLADLWAMVARSAYTQLRYSPLLLLGTVLGLLLVYAVPPAALIAGAIVGATLPTVLGGITWLIMTLAYVPMLRFYRIAPLAAVLLPLIALLYLAMTVDSARRHAVGRGGTWKGRVNQRT
jgi:hopene-associated glycosyltransferase HpnB